MTSRWLTCLAGLALAGTACSSSSGTAGPGHSPGASDTATATAGASASGSVFPGGEGGNATPGTQGSPGSLHLPPLPSVGTYRYSTALDLAQGGAYQGSRTLSYFRATVAGSDARILIRQTTQIEGQPEKEWWYRRIFRQGGMYLERQYEPTGADCALQEPILELRFPLAAGASWTGESTCRGSGQRISIRSSVSKKENVTVGGRTVSAFVVQRSIVTGQSQPLHETWWWYPAGALIVHMTTQSSDPPLTIVDTMSSLNPEPLPEATPPPGF